MKKAPEAVNSGIMDSVYLNTRKPGGGKETTVRKTNGIWKALVATGIVGLVLASVGATTLYMNLHQIQHPLNAISNNYAIAMTTVGGVFTLIGIAALVKCYIVRKKSEELKKRLKIQTNEQQQLVEDQRQEVINTTNKQLIQLTQDLKSREDLLAFKEQEIARLENEIGSANIKNGELKEHIGQLETANTLRQDEISELKTHLQSVQEEFTNLQNEKKQLQEKTQKEIEELKQSLKNEEGRFFEANKQCMAKKHEAQSEQERHNKEITAQRHLYTEQQKLIQLQNEEIATLKIILDTAQKKEKTHIEDFDTYKNKSEIENQELRDKIKNLETDNANLKKSLENEVKRTFPTSSTRVQRARSLSKANPYITISESKEN